MKDYLYSYSNSILFKIYYVRHQILYSYYHLSNYNFLNEILNYLLIIYILSHFLILIIIHYILLI